MKAIRLIELFAGIGSQAAALKRLGVDFEHYKAVEFDKYAIKLQEEEPELFEELAADYPCEDATYIFKVQKIV